MFNYMRRHPDWLKVKIGGGETFVKMKSLLRDAKLHTICEEAKCPNIAECFGCGTAVFLILGDVCTRNCRYCNVKHGTPFLLNPSEPKDVAGITVWPASDQEDYVHGAILYVDGKITLYQRFTNGC